MSADSNTLKNQITEDMKAAMRAKEQRRLSAIRMLIAAVKQKEIDEQISLDDTQTMQVIEKLVKQRKDSISQFEKADRQDLIDIETAELKVLQAYLPEPLTQAEIDTIIKDTISELGASDMKDMGKTIQSVKAKLQGRADMSDVSKLIKEKLS